jgi:hypothetical protein
MVYDLPMELHPYLKSIPPNSVSELAAKCGTTEKYLWKLARGAKRGLRPHPKVSALIEKESNQMVRRWESNPEEWAQIWPELIGLPGSPAIK